LKSTRPKADVNLMSAEEVS